MKGAHLPKATDLAQQTYLVGDLEVDPNRRTGSRNGEEIQLGNLTFDLLLLLIDESPRIVTHQQVVDRIWNKRHVTPETVRQRVKLLRRALRDNSENPRYFTVIRGQGYRLVPDVRTAGIVAAPNVPVWRPWAAGVSIVILLVIASVLTYLTQIGIADPGTGQPEARSVAVLPFANLSGDSADDSFVEGFHNDLVTQLAKLHSFDVISRTSVLGYRNGRKYLRQIGQELHVSAILDGSIQRSGDSVRINAQLVDARNDRHVWANIYDRKLTTENLLEIQIEIAAAIAGSLNVQLSLEERERLGDLPTENVRTHNRLLSGI